MSRIFTWLGTTALAVGLSLVPAAATAERNERDASAFRSAEASVEKLRAELARVNAEVAALKRGSRSMSNRYRLRERMADAEALAHKLTAAEAKLRAHPGASAPAPGGAPIVAPPAASPQDGSVELAAKADILFDQARKLDGEADGLAKAAGQLRSRRLMRRKAGRWERDPFAGLETSRRNVAASVPTPTKAAASTPTNDSETHGTATASDPTYSTPTVLGPNWGGTGAGAAPPPAAETTNKADTRAPAAEGAAAPKVSLVLQSGTADRQAVEQRLFLDPATAAELRQALGAGGAALDPEALERGAAALHARARTLKARAQELRARSRAP